MYLGLALVVGVSGFLWEMIFSMFYSVLRACPKIFIIFGLVFISLQNYKKSSFNSFWKKGKTTKRRLARSSAHIAQLHPDPFLPASHPP